MIELSFIMKIITINLGCYFRHPLYVNVIHSTTLRHQGRGVANILDDSGSGSGKKIYRIFFSKHGLVAPSEAGDIHFLRLRHQFLAKRFGGFWSGQKLPVSAPAPTPAPHFYLPLCSGWHWAPFRK